MFRRTKKKESVFNKGDPSRLFDLMECLGEGTYGTVWTGVEKETNRTCAIKIVKIDEDLPEIEQEIAIMKESDSPYIVKFIGAYWGEREKIWMVMEHCVAGSINDLMYVCDMTLNLDQARTTAAAITLGLTYLHKNLVIHRDIKAGNVLLTDEGHIRLADFGVSHKLKKASDRTTTAIGAPFWMAPEVIQEFPYDGRADVWSLGITVIELMEGRPPLSHMNAMKALFVIPEQKPPKLKDNKLPHDIQDFIRVCLNRVMKKRPTAKNMLQHNFIKSEARHIEVNDGKSEIMKTLVIQSLKEIVNMRNGEDNGGEASFGDGEESEEQVDFLNTTEKKKTSLYGNTTVTTDIGLETTTEGDKSTKFPPHIGQISVGSAGTSFINPSKDAARRLSNNIEPLRDVQAPNERRFGRKEQGEMDGAKLAEMMNLGVSEKAGLQAAVMSKEFIILLKTIYKSDPAFFSNKAPKNWTGEDITVAVVKTMNKMLQTGETGTGKEGLDTKIVPQPFRNKSVEETQNELLDFMNLGDFSQPFVVGVDGDKVPPPPRNDTKKIESDSEKEDSDLDL